MTPEVAMIEVRMRDAGLTRREREVVWLLMEGMNSREIGNMLDLTASTVRGYICHAATRLGITGNHRTRNIRIILCLLGRLPGKCGPS